MNTFESKHIDALRRRYGSHSDAARALAITPRAYRRIRQTGQAGPQTVKLILLLAKDGQS